MYAKKDAYYSFRENAWTMEANPCCLCIKKNQNAPILSEHPPVRRKIVKTFRWDQRLQIQKENLERAYRFQASPSPGGKNAKTFRWERRLFKEKYECTCLKKNLVVLL